MTDLLDQGGQHAFDFSDAFFELLGELRIEVTKVRRQQEVLFRLAGRPEGNLQKPG